MHRGRHHRIIVVKGVYEETGLLQEGRGREKWFEVREPRGIIDHSREDSADDCIARMKALSRPPHELAPVAGRNGHSSSNTSERDMLNANETGA